MTYLYRFSSLVILVVVVISAAPIGRVVFPQQPTIGGIAVVVIYIALTTWIGLRNHGRKKQSDDDE